MSVLALYGQGVVNHLSQRKAGNNMKKGDYIYTPRFCTVEIEKVFRNQENAYKAGYNEPTHYKNPEYGILGKNIGINQMIFAAFRK